MPPGPPPAAERGDAAEPDDHALGRSRGGFGSKIHLVTDGSGLALAVLLTGGQAAEVPCLQALLAAVRSDRSPTYLIGDRAYSRRAARTWLLIARHDPARPDRSGGVLGSPDPVSLTGGPFHRAMNHQSAHAVKTSRLRERAYMLETADGRAHGVGDGIFLGSLGSVEK